MICLSNLGINFTNFKGNGTWAQQLNFSRLIFGNWILMFDHFISFFWSSSAISKKEHFLCQQLNSLLLWPYTFAWLISIKISLIPNILIPIKNENVSVVAINYLIISFWSSRIRINSISSLISISQYRKPHKT